MPAEHNPTDLGTYDIYPANNTAHNIERGFEALAGQLSITAAQGHAVIALEGYCGVLWKEFVLSLAAALSAQGTKAFFLNVRAALKDEAEVQSSVCRLNLTPVGQTHA